MVFLPAGRKRDWTFNVYRFEESASNVGFSVPFNTSILDVSLSDFF